MLRIDANPVGCITSTKASYMAKVRANNKKQIIRTKRITCPIGSVGEVGTSIIGQYPPLREET